MGGHTLTMEAVQRRPRGVKRLKTLDKIEEAKSARKKHFDNKPTHDPLPSSSGSEISDEEHVSGESVLYDNLLKALGSASEKLSGLYKRRLREQEGKSDSEEDNDGGSLSASVSEEDSSEEGSECGPTEVMDRSEGDATGDESSDGDAMHDFEDNGDIVVNGTENTSSYHVHLGYILPNEEDDKLNKKKWQFKWEMPAIGMPMSKWVGTGENVLKEVNSDQVYGVKQKLFDHWTNIYKNFGSKDLHLLRQKYFFSLCNSYRDILHCNKKPFYQRAKEEDSSIMDAYIMHALNHVYHTRDRVTKNDAKLNKHQESTKEEILSGGSFLDQGFTRPKVLILLPLGSIALRVVKRLIQLTPLTNRANVEHFARFSDEFETIDGEGEDDMNGVSSKTKKPGKPADFQVLFGGNNNDHFMMGIKFTKRSIKLYSDFYSSDIIVASPLGLITKIGDAEVEKEKDVDYLSSIEVLIIDHADVIGMQNWSHVNTVVEHLNRTPSKQHGTDVMRIRQWYLDGHARFYRQTILVGSFLNPEMNALFNRLCVNYEGKVKLISEYKGILPKVLLQVRQVYERFAATSVVDADDTRLDFFCKKVFPKIKDSIEGHTMLFISSYFEFVRIRNFLKSQNASFCLLGEYTKPSDISRARTWFYEGKRKIMLYTERAHFYHRYKIRGIQNLIVYSLPERKEFYPEIINMLEGSKNMMCTVLFSCFDQLRLERIVGTSAAKRMLSSEKGIFVFC